MASSLNDMWPVSKTLIPFKVLFLYGYQIHESPLNNQRYAKVTWSTRTLCVFVTRFSQSFFDNNFALRLLAKFCLHIPSSPPLAVIQFSMSRDKLYKMSMTAGFFFTTLNAGNIILKKSPLSIDMSIKPLMQFDVKLLIISAPFTPSLTSKAVEIFSLKLTMAWFPNTLHRMLDMKLLRNVEMYAMENFNWSQWTPTAHERPHAAQVSLPVTGAWHHHTPPALVTFISPFMIHDVWAWKQGTKCDSKWGKRMITMWPCSQTLWFFFLLV